jgi:quercetin dioxygenase-like cupin family protein
MTLLRWDRNRDGPFTDAALRQKLQRLGYRVTRYVYPPGTCFSDHSHPVDKMDAVVSGRFRMVIDGREITLEAGDMLAVPAGVVHSAAVVGEEQVISLDGVKI